jgi:Gpi18-like mannosyltransferase
MNAYRRTATIVGLLYIIGTVAGVLSKIVTAGLLDGPDYLGALATHASRAQWGALLTLVMGVALAMVPALMFPIMRRQNEVLAVGYVIFRGALETLTYVGVAMCWLLLAVDARQYVDAGVDVAAQFSGIGRLLAKAMDPTIAIQDIVVSVGALMFYVLLYRAGLVPRWLSGWGIVGVIGYLTAGLIALFSAQLVILLMPLAVQEMVMAAWLIVKGFNPGAPAPERDRPVEGDRQPVAV